MDINNETAIPLDTSKPQLFNRWHMFAILLFVMLLASGRYIYRSINAGDWVAAALPLIFFSVFFIGAVAWEAFKAKRGLVFNSLGIIDNSMSRQVFIPWSEITGSDFVKRQEKEFFVVKVRNPQKYKSDNKELTSFIQEQLIKHFNSPFAINCASLKIALPELQSLFETYHRQYGSR